MGFEDAKNTVLADESIDQSFHKDRSFTIKHEKGSNYYTVDYREEVGDLGTGPVSASVTCESPSQAFEEANALLEKIKPLARSYDESTSEAGYSEEEEKKILDQIESFMKDKEERAHLKRLWKA